MQEPKPHTFSPVGTSRPCGPGCELRLSSCSGCGLQKRERVIDGIVVGVDVKLREAWPWVEVNELLEVARHAGVTP